MTEAANQPATNRPEVDSRLADMVAIVTGGAGTIGAAIARRLEAAGAKVVVGDVAPSHDFDWEFLDVTDEESVAQLVDSVARQNNRLDIIVNNAGIMFETPVSDQDRSRWDKMLATNLTGPMLLTKHAAPHLTQFGMGSIINIGSIEGDRCNPGHAAYAATKAGLHGLTRATAVDLGPVGIRCNAIAPGWIDTPLNATYVDTHPDRDGLVDELAKLHPIGRVGSGTDVADVAVWLASDESRFVTGQVITVDGGRTVRPSLPTKLM